MTAKRPTSFDELKALWHQSDDAPECTNPECPNKGRIQVHVESISITNLIVANELTPEIRDMMSRGARYTTSR